MGEVKKFVEVVGNFGGVLSRRMVMIRFTFRKVVLVVGL